jgi:hypothetical protein
MVKLSQTSKMPCKSISLPIEETCSGKAEEDGSIKEVCEECYALNGAYNWPNSVNLKAHNLAETKRDEFVPDMINKLYKMLYFRWFDSGDVENEIMLQKIYLICLETPSTLHWIPTKSRDLFDQDLWNALSALPNVMVRFSSPSKHGVYNDNHGSVVISDKSELTDQMFLCRAKSIGFKKNGKPNPKKCHNCRACWYTQKVVAYEFH